MKKTLLSILIVGLVYSQCDESNWQEHYNSEGHNMQECYLEGANLVGANLVGANLVGANLVGANLSEANLYWANLYFANLEGACLEGAISFTQTNYIGVPTLEGCAFSGEDCSFEDTNQDGYDDVSYISGYVAGHSDGVIFGVESVDITIDNQASYDEGFLAGKISADINNDGFVDEFPVISIIGGAAQILIQGSSDHYMDSGATCSDQEDGNLFHGVEVSGAVVNINNPGMYIIEYNCSDSDGNAAPTKQRIVFVVDACLFVDENADGYDDASYIAGSVGGDLNLDSVINVADIVSLVNLILNGE